MSEQTIQRRILEYLTTQGWAVKIVTCNKRGTPDILACIEGRFVAIEVKAPRGRLSKVQEVQLAKIERAGGITIVARSVDAVIAGLACIDRPAD